MECKWHDCSNEARPRSPYCSGTCKKRAQRASGTDVPVKVGQAQSGTDVGQGPAITKIDAATMGSTDVAILRALHERIAEAKPPTELTYAQRVKLAVARELKLIRENRPRPANFGLPDCTCQHCQNNRANGSKHVLNHGAYKTAAELGDKELNRVSLPGDADYVGVAV